MGVISAFDISDVRDLTIAPDQSLWIIGGLKILHLKSDGTPAGPEIATVAKPMVLAFDNRGRLIVCDDGPDQQVKFFEVNGEPKQVATFGQRGGLLTGTPGEVAPTKLFSLRGAGTDKDGNLYVSMGFGGAPVGNLVLRSFTPNGELRWELMSLAFVDTFGFDPDSDGARIYSRTATFDLDLSKHQPGREWRLTGITLDHVNHPDDPRLPAGMTAYLRHLDGRRILYTIGQYAGGYHIFTFDEPNGLIAHEVNHILATKKDGEQWTWDIAPNGDIWHGDAPGRTIRRYPFNGFSPDGKPRYDWSKPQTWPWPDDFENVRRIIYEPRTDTLCLFGYLKGQKIDSWGVVGFTGRRYNGWLAGNREIAWTNTHLPTNPKGSDQGGPLSASGVSIAGDYLFFGMVKPEQGKQYVHILNVADGSYVGSFVPGEAVGGNAGWEDMPYSLQAFKRKNGEYLVLVEEDWRGKNLLYRWTPASTGAEVTPQASSPRSAPDPAAHLSEYRAELEQFRREYGGARALPDVSFFLFGMGQRTKLLYKDGSLIDARTHNVLRHWEVKGEVIVPPDYAVHLTTSDGKSIGIVEDERAVWIEQDGKREPVAGTESPVHLPNFSTYAYPGIMRVLHQELLINVVEGKPVPNYLVYPKPWYRDGAMMAMCFKTTGNLDLIKDWILHLSDPFDHNNGGESEADNLGQALYLISLVSDKHHPLVERVLSELRRFEVSGPEGKYLRGRSDFAEHPVYQTKWAKFGLNALGLPDPYTIPRVGDSYSALFWMAYRDEYVPTKDAADAKDYPYLRWATDHFHHQKHGPISNRDYPLTWEGKASQANYAGMSVISEQFSRQRLATPHTWHAAEVLLYLLSESPSDAGPPAKLPSKPASTSAPVAQ